MSEQKKTWKREIEFVRDVEPLEPTPEFTESCQAFGIALDAAEIERLGRYLNLLITNNERVNLTAVKDAASGWMRHIFDALTLLAILGELDGSGSTPRIADVGSGGGVPGIPLAIAMPGARFALIEATGKKAAFLTMAGESLGLEHVEIVNERAEIVGQDSFMRAGFDVVVARAVGPLPTVAELTVPLARVGGLVVLTKGERAEEELAGAKGALHRLCVRHETTVSTPTGRIIVLAKDRETPRMYPRRSGEPKREPLS